MCFSVGAGIAGVGAGRCCCSGGCPGSGGAGGCCGGGGAGAVGFGVVVGSAFGCMDLDRALLCSLLTMSITIAWIFCSSIGATTTGGCGGGCGGCCDGAAAVIVCCGGCGGGCGAGVVDIGSVFGIYFSKYVSLTELALPFC